MVDQIPLLVAAGNGHTDIVQLLVQHGANVNTMVRHETVAGFYQHTTLSQFFLPPPFLSSLFPLFSLSSQSSDTLSTPLHEAATVNSLPTVEFLEPTACQLRVTFLPKLV